MNYKAFLTEYWHPKGTCISKFFHEKALSYLHDSNEILTVQDWIEHFKTTAVDEKGELSENACDWHTTVDRIADLGNDNYMTITFHRSANWNGFVTSIFTIKDGLIAELHEYYSPCDDNIVPQWRTDLKDAERI